MREVIVQRVIERGWPEDWYAMLNLYGSFPFHFKPFLNHKAHEEATKDTEDFFGDRVQKKFHARLSIYVDLFSRGGRGVFYAKGAKSFLVRAQCLLRWCGDVAIVG